MSRNGMSHSQVLYLNCTRSNLQDSIQNVKNLEQYIIVRYLRIHQKISTIRKSRINAPVAVYINESNFLL